jgi:glutamyl endopeptidase
MMTNSYSRVLRGSSFGMILSLVVAALVAPAPAAADQNDLPMSNTGVVAPAGAETNLGGISPFAGTGQLTARDIKESGDGWTPSSDEIRGLPPVSGNGIESVIGLDTRLRLYPSPTYPARAIALITFTGGYCTGWFIGSRAIATAGHCVHTGGPGGAWRTNVRVYPGYNAGSAPYGSFAATTLFSVTGWTNSSLEEYDYGAVRVGTNIGNTVGWFGFWWQSTSLTGLPEAVTGYPGDKSPLKSLWTAHDEIRSTTTRQVFYKNDTAGGQSGSPVWHDRPPGSSFCSNGPCVNAIHAYGLHGASPHSNHNHGTRITQTVFNNLIAWR